MNKKYYDHIMIDIETLGVSSTAVIQSIGAISFDIETGEMGEYAFLQMSIQSCLDFGLKVDGDTIKFWLSQPKETIDSILKSDKEYLLDCGLHWLNMFFSSHNKHTVKVWANRPQFDIAILKNAYLACNMPPLWDRNNERDARTIIELFPEVRNEVEFSGLKHTPIDDCRYQIELLSKAYNKIKKS